MIAGVYIWSVINILGNNIYYSNYGYVGLSL